jgi:hypothetical protein
MGEQLLQLDPLELAHAFRAPPLAAVEEGSPLDVSPPARAVIGRQKDRFQQTGVRHDAAPTRDTLWSRRATSTQSTG